MINFLYFKIFNAKIDPYVKINLMGIIAFLKSAIKHFRRGSPSWIIVNQFKGIWMCSKQLIEEEPK